jgi:hypothetical protein
MRNTAFKYGSLIIGLLAALTIIFSQSFNLESKLSEKSSTQQTDSSNPGADESSEQNDIPSFSISATSFPSVAQFEFFQQAVCLFEIIFNQDFPHEIPDASPFSLNKFFSVTLRVIISPNAPPL